MLKKFESSDVFVNRIKAYPKVRIFTYSGSLYYNNSAVATSGVKLYDFLNEPPIPPSTPIFIESFDFIDGWSGTISNPLYYLTFTFNSAWVEDFDFIDGWSGTISNPLYYLTFTFNSAWVEDFDTGW